MSAVVLILLLCLWTDFAYGEIHGFTTRRRFSSPFSSPSFNYENFNRYDNITRELMRLHNEYPHMVNILKIGRTHENRALNVVKISGDLRVKNKVSMWIDAGIHAREWVSVSTAMIFIQELISSYDHDLMIHDLLNRVDFYILPVMNPDGYEYSHTKERCWRKNRRPMKCSFDGYNSTCCAGVDLNRNYDWYFGTTSVGTPCEEFYPGPYPTSEPETVAVMEFLEKHPVKAVVSMHTCGQFMMIPYGHLNGTYSPNYRKERELAEKAASALYGEYGTKYKIGTPWEVAYENSGTSVDWMKSQLRVPYVYTFEQRQACNDGRPEVCELWFGLPLEDIRPTGLETFEAIKVIATEMIKLYG